MNEREICALRRFRRGFPACALRVRQLRDLAGLTQPQLAARVGVNRRTIARWEAGKRRPRRRALAALGLVSERLGVLPLAAFFASQAARAAGAATWASAERDVA